MFLKQSTSVVIQFGPFVDATDGVTAETGLVSALDHASTGIMLSKNGGAFAVRHATVTASTYDAHGCYRVTLDTTDTGTLGTLRVIYTDPTTCVAVWRDFLVLPANVYDSLVGGSDNLQVDVAQFGNANGTFASGRPEVNTSHVAGTSQTAGDICGKLGTPSNLGGGATIAANLADIESQTDDIGAAGAGLTAIAAVGAVTGNVGGSVLGDLGGDVIGSVNGNVDGQVAGLAAGAITAASIAANAITAAKIATDAVGAAQLAADAITEIQSGLSTLTAAGVRSAVGLASANLDTQLGAIDDYVDTEVAAIATAITTLQTKLKKYVQLLARKDAAIATDNATELGELNANGGSGAGSFDNTTDSEQAIRDRGDAAWGSAGSAPQVLVDTTVANVVDQTHFELTAAVGGNSTYANQTVVFYDASASDAPSVRKITAFADASNAITIDSAPDFTVVNGDGVKIFVTPPGTTAPTAAENAAELLNTVNTSSNDPTKVGGQLRRTHARVGGTVQTQDRAVANAPVVSRNEADSAALVTQTPSVDGAGKTTWTPS